MPRISLQRLSKTFGARHVALNEMSLEIADREFLAILGPSGSGKSTMVRLIAGLETPSAGRILFDGQDVTDTAPRHRDVAMVFQNQSPFPHLNVYENLAFSARARNVASNELDDRVGQVATQIGLSDALTRSPDTLSGGERQRLAMGRAIVRRPKILLLDEPFTNLDTPLRRDLRRVLLDFHSELGVTTVFVTHDQDEALGVGDRVAVVDRGNLMQINTPATLVEAPECQFVAWFLGEPPMGLLPVEWGAIDGRRQLVCQDSIEKTVEIDHGSPPGEGAFTMGLRARDVHPEHESNLVALTLPIRALERFGLDSYARLGRVDGLWMSLPRDHRLKLGETVRVHLNLREACWFDRETGRRVR